MIRFQRAQVALNEAAVDYAVADAEWHRACTGDVDAATIQAARTRVAGCKQMLELCAKDFCDEAMRLAGVSPGIVAGPVTL